MTVPLDTAKIKGEYVEARRLATALRVKGPFEQDAWRGITAILCRMSITREFAFRWAQDEEALTTLLLKDTVNAHRELRKRVHAIARDYGILGINTDVDVRVANSAHRWKRTIPPVLVERDMVTIVKPWRTPPGWTLGLLD